MNPVAEISAAAPNRCQSCDTSELHEIAGFPQLPRVTSDSKPFRSGGRLFVCMGCGLVQKIADAHWLAEINEIYRDYEMYHQSSANDQVVFDAVSGRPSGRCEVLARHLLQSGVLPVRGALLDVGAGSGAMLGAFSQASSDWRLFGLDLDSRKEPALKAIPRFEKLYTVAPDQLSRQFDLLTLIHSLEHFADPLAMLRTLRSRLSAGGHLFVEVNNAGITPFDLVVADHLCHFTAETLAAMTARAGLNAALTKTDWVHKEISLLASAGAGPSAIPAHDPQQALQRTREDVGWLTGMLDHALRSSQAGRFAIFGTSVAATWLAHGLGGNVEFFVDEDPAREGHTHMGRPILKPAQVPEGVTVYLAFVQTVAQSIRNRLRDLSIAFVSPADAKGQG